MQLPTEFARLLSTAISPTRLVAAPLIRVISLSALLLLLHTINHFTRPTSMTVKNIEGPEEWEEAIDLERDEIAVILLFNSEAEAGNSIRRDFDEVSAHFPSFDHYMLDVANSEELLKSADLEDVEAPSLIAFRGSRQYGPAESISVEDLETVSDDIKAFLQGLPVSSD